MDEIIPAVLMVAIMVFAFTHDLETFSESTIKEHKQFEMDNHLYRCTYSENDAKFQEAKKLKEDAEVDAKELANE